MKLLALFCLVLFAGCPPKVNREVAPVGKEDSTPKDTVEVPAKETETKTEPTEKKLLVKSFSKADIFDDAKFKGKAISGLSWNDKNGDNVVVFSRAPEKGDGGGTVWLYANHFVRKGGNTTVLREVKQKATCDEFDLIAEFRNESFVVTDLDKDGIGEATFAYRYTCTSDVSPMTYKLLVIENGDKYILRGYTRVMDTGGEFKEDDSFAKNPTFLDHAKKVWAATREDEFN